MKKRARMLSLLGLFMLICPLKLHAYTVTMWIDKGFGFEMTGEISDSSGYVYLMNGAPQYYVRIELPSGSWMSMENNVESWIERSVSPGGDIKSVIHFRAWSNAGYNLVEPGFLWMHGSASAWGAIRVVPEINGIPSPIIEGSLPNFGPSQFSIAEEGYYTSPFDIMFSRSMEAQGPGQEWNEQSWEYKMTLIEPIPEPTTILFLGSGLLGLAVIRRKFRMK